MFRTKIQTSLSILSIALLMVACGGEETPTGGNGLPPGFKVPDPEIRQLAPTNISLGETMTIMGGGFINPQYGQTRISFEGNYVTSAGRVYPVKMEVSPKHENQGVLKWTFGPNVPFASVDDIGSFLGTVKVRNIGLNNEIKVGAKAMSAKIQVKPSIIIKQMRPQSAGCSAGLTDTVDEAKFLFEVKAVGLKSGTQGAPLRVVYSFLKENFQFKGWISGKLNLDPDSLFPKKGPVSVIDLVTNGNISTLGKGAPKDIYVNKGQPNTIGTIDTSIDKLFGLQDLITAPVPNVVADYYTANMNILAIDSQGNQAQRTVVLKVWSAIEVDYKGGYKVVQSFDPTPVSGCINGGDIGRDVTYSELTSETRSRSIKYIAKASGGFDIKVVRLNAEFGMEVEGSVSSSKSKDLKITGKILPKQWAAFYRQTLQVERNASLRAHGPCGSTQDLGQVVVTDWVWSPDLAKKSGGTCPPLPKSNLSKGQKFE